MMNQDATPAPQQQSGLLPWQQGWNAFKSVWPQLLYISAATIAIPQYLFYWSESLRAAQIGRDLSFEARLGLESIQEIVKLFSLRYFFIAAALTFLATLGYFSIVALCIQVKEGASPQIKQALRRGIRVFFPRHWLNIPLLLGLSLLAALVLFVAPGLGILGQYIAITLLVLLGALPVLLCLNPESFGRALRGALRVDYAINSGISRWSAFFVLLTYQMGLIGLISLIKFGQEWLRQIDLNLQLQRDAWFHVNNWWPFGLQTTLLEALVHLLLSCVIGLFAIFTSSFIFDLREKSAQKAALARPKSE